MPANETVASAMFRALRSVDVDPELAYAAVEETRHQAGENVITEIKAEMNVCFAEVNVCFAEVNARLDTLAGRMDTLQKTLWPLVVALSVALLSAVGGGLFALLQN